MNLTGIYFIALLITWIGSTKSLALEGRFDTNITDTYPISESAPEILAIAPLFFEMNRGWVKGFSGINPNWISLRSLESEAIDSGKKLQFELDLLGKWFVKSCDPSTCENRVEIKPNKTQNLTLEGAGFQVNLSGYPCSLILALSKCIFNVPSWALSSMNKNNGISAFPRFAIAVFSRNRMDIVDMMRKKIWISIPLQHEFNDNLLTSHIVSEGVVIVKGSSTAFRFDFKSDKITKYDSNGISQSAGGIASPGGFEMLMSLDDPSPLLSVSGNWVHWKGFALEFNEQTIDPANLIPTFFESKSVSTTMDSSFLLEHNSDRQTLWGLKTNELEKINEISNMESTEWLLHGSDIYSKSNKGLRLYKQDQFMPTSIGERFKIMLSDYPLIFAKTNTPKSSGCHIVPFKSNPKDPASFIEMKLGMPCTDKVGYTYSPHGEAAVSLQPEKFVFKWRTKK